MRHPGDEGSAAGGRRAPGGGGRHRGSARGLQRGIIILPSAFTLGNLFFGIYAVVAAFRGELEAACWYVVVAAILDMLDGRVARFTRTGSAFGAELDSLVDAISFGVAPGILLYVLYLQEGAWSWLLAFVYVTAVVVRLARFNVEQAGLAKSHFHGLPSPTAGMIVATFYPFSRTPFFEAWLAGLPWLQILSVGVVLLSVLMVSHIPYPVMPRIGLSSARGLAATALVVGAVFATVTVPRYFFFTFLVLYTVQGLVRAVILGLLERLPERDPLLDEDGEEADEAGAEIRRMDYGDVAPGRFPDSASDDPDPDDPSPKRSENP